MREQARTLVSAAAAALLSAAPGGTLEAGITDGGGAWDKRALGSHRAVLRVDAPGRAAHAVIAWRRRTTLRDALVTRPAVDSFLRSFGLLAVLGMLLNDSGIAVPAVMLGVAIPWLVADLLEPAVRRGRE